MELASSICTPCWQIWERVEGWVAPAGLYVLSTNTSHTSPCRGGWVGGGGAGERG